jgi:Tol biopolymer transport system component
LSFFCLSYMKKTTLSIFIFICFSLALLPSHTALAATCKVAFQTNRDGNYELYVMGVDGSAQTRITNNPATDAGAAWSPDGTRLAFFSTRDGAGDIYVMNADGTDVQRLTTRKKATSDQPPTWSPDGTRLAYSESGKDIYVMGVDGSARTRITSPATTDSAPAWSPDGTRLAFQSTRNGSYDIYSMNIDGTDVQRLTTHGAIDSAPTWSPDGTRLAFFSNRTSGGWRLFTMNVDGTNQAIVMDDGYEDSRPVWLSNDSLIFQSDWGGQKISSVFVDGSGVALLTPEGGERPAVWCSDFPFVPDPPDPPINPTIVPTLDFSGDLSGMSTIADEQVALWQIASPVAPYLYALAMGIIVFSFFIPLISRFTGGLDKED